ncbi:hypothetical protein ACHHYP_20871, partial [Achlya hypogyna]
TRRKGWKNYLLVDACCGIGIDCNETDLKAVFWGKLEAHVSATPPVIVTMAREKGHKVLFTASIHSRLQPIEIVWALVDGHVVRGYREDRSFLDVREALD